VKAPPANAAKTSSGLASKVIKPGSGKGHPNREDLVTVNYTGWTTDGKMFDSSIGDGKPVTFPLDKVISGWTEGLQLMVGGETRRFWIPEALAYGGRRDPKGMLVFDVELLSFAQSPTQAPADVKAPPASAKKTATGLAYQVLTPGKGTRHPRASDQVTVHYSGWTTDGKLFDSSVTRGEPATFPLNGVIAGWTEGLQLMVEGEKARFWIPEALAYKGQRDPKGMLVFDVELIRIN
jgi:peptidylprolyl isomerase